MLESLQRTTFRVSGQETGQVGGVAPSDPPRSLAGRRGAGSPPPRIPAICQIPKTAKNVPPRTGAGGPGALDSASLGPQTPLGGTPTPPKSAKKCVLAGFSRKFGVHPNGKRSMAGLSHYSPRIPGGFTLPHRSDRTLGQEPRSEPRAPMQMVSGALGSFGVLECLWKDVRERARERERERESESSHFGSSREWFKKVGAALPVRFFLSLNFSSAPAFSTRAPGLSPLPFLSLCHCCPSRGA